MNRWLLRIVTIFLVPCFALSEAEGSAATLHHPLADGERGDVASVILSQEALSQRPLFKLSPPAALASEIVRSLGLVTFSDVAYDAVIAGELLNRMQNVIDQKGQVVMGLPFGNTPKGIFRVWRENHHDFPWSKVVFVNGDEYVGLGPGHKDSARHQFDEQIMPLTEYGLRRENVHWIQGDADPQKAIQDYQEFLQAHGGRIDILLMGIANGPWEKIYRPLRAIRQRWPRLSLLVSWLASSMASVHVFFNERNSSWDSRMRAVQTSWFTVFVNKFKYGHTEIHRNAITIGLADVRESGEVIMIANTPQKWTAVDMAVFGARTRLAPATVIQHPDLAGRVTVFVNESTEPRRKAAEKKISALSLDSVAKKTEGKFPADIIELALAILDVSQKHFRLLAGLSLDPSFDRQKEWEIQNHLHALQVEFSRRLAHHPALSLDLVQAFHEEKIQFLSSAIDDILGIHPKEGIGTQEIGDEAMLNVSTPYAVLRRVFRSVPIEPKDVVYDLGCGWGRPSLYAGIVTRAKKVVGIEISRERILESAASVKRLGLKRVNFIHQNVIDSNFEDGTVFFLYNPFSEETLAHTLKAFRRIAVRRALRGKVIQIISIGGLSTLRLRKQDWLLEKAVLKEGPVGIFLFESRLSGNRFNLLRILFKEWSQNVRLLCRAA